MSIQTRPVRLVFSSLDTNSIDTQGGVITIPGLPSFSAGEINNKFCSRACATPCVPQEVTITPTVPASTCECPYLWELKIIKLPCTRTYRTQESFQKTEFYNYTDESGAALTVNDIVESIVNQINDNPDSVVTAVPTGSQGSYTAFTITEKDCDSSFASCGFNAFISSGQFSAPTAHERAILNADEIAREFPITHMAFMNRPELAYCGEYCKYQFRIIKIHEELEPHLANTLEDVYIDVEIFVNKSLPNFYTDWDTPIATAITCLGPALTPPGEGGEGG